MANFQINTITGKDSKRGTSFVGVTTVSSTGSMRIPSGPTEHRGGRGRGFFGGGYGASSPYPCLLYTSPSPRDKRQSRMPSSA